MRAEAVLTEQWITLATSLLLFPQRQQTNLLQIWDPLQFSSILSGASICCTRENSQLQDAIRQVSSMRCLPSVQFFLKDGYYKDIQSCFVSSFLSICLWQQCLWMLHKPGHRELFDATVLQNTLKVLSTKSRVKAVYIINQSLGVHRDLTTSDLPCHSEYNKNIILFSELLVSTFLVILWSGLCIYPIQNKKK